MIFFDTNIFVYAVSAAEADLPRRQVAVGLIAETDFGVSIQIIQEFMDVTLRKKHLGLTLEEITAMVERISTFPLVETSLSLAYHALELKTRYNIRYWDASILAAALELNCDILYSEDLSHGQDYEGVKVINPFR